MANTKYTRKQLMDFCDTARFGTLQYLAGRLAFEFGGSNGATWFDSNRHGGRIVIRLGSMEYVTLDEVKKAIRATIQPARWKPQRGVVWGGCSMSDYNTPEFYVEQKSHEGIKQVCITLGGTTKRATITIEL